MSELTPEREIQVPKQERSRRTFANLLKAARELLKDDNFDDIAISTITARAGASVGSFYARFPDKTALLAALQEDAMADIRKRLTQTLDPGNFARSSLNTTVTKMMSFLVEIPDRHVPVFKAAFFAALDNPVLARNVTEFTDFKVGLVTRLIMSKREEIRSADPHAVVISGARMVEAILQHRRIRAYVEPRAYFIKDDSLCRELTQMYLFYLAGGIGTSRKAKLPEARVRKPGLSRRV